MALVISRCRVRDFAKWKSVFGSPEGTAARKAAGMKSMRVFRSAEDANDITVLLEFASVAKARKYFEDKAFLEKQPGAHVIEIWFRFLEEVKA